MPNCPTCNRPLPVCAVCGKDISDRSPTAIYCRTCANTRRCRTYRARLKAEKGTAK